MNTMLRSLVCPLALAAGASLVSAQAKSHDALAFARAKAKAENQRVLFLLTGDASPVQDQLIAALGNYRVLGKLVRYEYQLAAQPGTSLAARAAVTRLRIEQPDAPALIALTPADEVLGTLSRSGMVSDGQFDPARVKGFLDTHVATPVDARDVLAQGIAAARKSKRHAFVYLSAPW